MNTTNSRPEDYEQLSRTQERIIEALPIPAAILSVFGSSAIIYMAFKFRAKKAWTPYNRLLIGMSVFDIIFSITLSLSTFMLPRETSTKIWAMGNDATCSMIGFLNQLSFDGSLYNAMLSFYFLLTARFGFKNKRISKRIEPLMHLLCIGYPFVTALVGLVMDFYSEPGTGIGCWVKQYPKQCGFYAPDGNGEECISPQIAWAFGASIGMLTFGTLLINNLIIWCFVRKQTGSREKSVLLKSLREHSMIDDMGSHSSHLADHKIRMDRKDSLSLWSSVGAEIPCPTPSMRHNTMVDNFVKANQNSRLRLVSSQAMLFVGCYFICNLWTWILRLQESQTTNLIQEKELPVKHYPLVVLQAWFYPLQGLFNMLVYIRPKYLKCRKEFPTESIRWAFCRALIGERFSPLHDDDLEASAVVGDVIRRGSKKRITPNKEDEVAAAGILKAHTKLLLEIAAMDADPASKPLDRHSMSSLSASEGDFSVSEGVEIPEEDLEKSRWGEHQQTSLVPQKQKRQRRSGVPISSYSSSLAMISEYSEEVVADASGSSELDEDSRWSSSSQSEAKLSSRHVSSTTPNKQMPERSNDERPSTILSDAPLRIPTRRQSPTNLGLDIDLRDLFNYR